MTPSMFANVVLVVVAVSLASVNAQNVTCYNCNSVSNSWCGDSLNVAQATEAGTTCTGTYCLKISGSSSVGLSGSGVTRSCVATGTNGCAGGSISVGVSASGYYCTCSTNFCNSATSTVSSIMTTIAAAAGVVLHVAARRLH